MQEIAFRSFLASQLSERSVQSYVSNCRRVQRELNFDLDLCDLSEKGINNIRRQLQSVEDVSELSGPSLSNCISAIRSYSKFRSWMVPSSATVLNYDQIKTLKAGDPPQLKLPIANPISAQVMPGRPDLIREASVRALLILHGQIMDELRQREIIRTGNGPVGDYAEFLFTRAFGWRLESNSSAGHDAIDSGGIRYQIKSRRITPRNPSRQLSAIRRLPERTFDFLAGILFDENYQIKRAIFIPHDLVLAKSKKVEQTNSWRFMLEDRLWDAEGVQEVTSKLMAAAETI